MGRFATTVTLYEELRTPYPPAFFREVAQQLALTKAHALIDLGTGPGLLALGFAPYVGRIVGVDPEPAMLAAAKKAAERAGQDLTLIAGKAEDLPDDIGPFDVVTIGRALHWMDRGLTLERLERLVAPDGVILVCSSVSAGEGRNPWLEDYNAARRAWSNESLWSDSGSAGRTHRDLAGFFRGTRFQAAELIKVETSRRGQPAQPGAPRDDVLVVLARRARRPSGGDGARRGAAAVSLQPRGFYRRGGGGDGAGGEAEVVGGLAKPNPPPHFP